MQKLILALGVMSTAAIISACATKQTPIDFNSAQNQVIPSTLESKQAPTTKSVEAIKTKKNKSSKKNKKTDNKKAENNKATSAAMKSSDAVVAENAAQDMQVQ